MNAASDRTKARDLYDLGFLVESHGDSLSTEQLLRADEFTRDYKALASRYRRPFEVDPLLRDFATAEERALVFRIGVVEQMHHRRQPFVEQAIPRAWSLAEVLALHKIWLESDGQEGSRAVLSGRKFAREVLCGMNFERAELRRADFRGADLRNANLRNSDLSQAMLDNADLRGADFSGSDLRGVSLRSSMHGPTTKGLPHALRKIARSGQTPYMPNRRAPYRAQPERELGPLR